MVYRKTNKEANDALKVCYYPFNASENPYVDINKSILACIVGGQVGKLPRTIELIKKLPFFLFGRDKYNVIILNWFENRLVNNAGALTLKHLVGFWLQYILLLISADHVVYVRHNKYPHSTIPKYQKVVQTIISLAASLSHSRVAHCPTWQSRGYFYVPHPLYDRLLEPMENRYSKPVSSNYYLMFGRIQPYKNIHEVISLWDESCGHLVVAGKTSDASYEKKIIELAANKKNVTVLNDYIEEDYAQYLASNASGIITAHGEDNCVVSGNIFFAMTVNTPLLSMKNDFIEDMNVRNKRKIIKTYDNVKEMIFDIRGNSYKSHEYNYPEDVLNQFSRQTVKLSWIKLLKKQLRS